MVEDMKKYIHIPSAREKADEAQAEDIERRKAISMGDHIIIEENNPKKENG